MTSDDHWAGPGYPLGYARKGRKCDGCQEIIEDLTYRIYPTNCRECLERAIHENPGRFSKSKYSVVKTMNLSVSWTTAQ